MLWRIHFQLLDRPLSRWTIQYWRPFQKDRPIYPETVHFSLRGPPRSERPSSFRQKTVHFNPGSSTFDRLSTFPLLDRSRSPGLFALFAMNCSYYSLFVQSELFVVRTIWLEQCERRTRLFAVRRALTYCSVNCPSWSFGAVLFFAV